MSEARDDSFHDYVARVKGLVTAEVIASNASNLRPAGKFEGSKPVPYRGYTIITPPYDAEKSRENNRSYEQLAGLQGELLKQVDGNTFVAVPISSFHITIADLISGRTWEEQDQIENCGSKLVTRIGAVFHRAGGITRHSPPNLLVLGLSLFPSVIVAVVTSEDASGYDQLISVRNQIYEDSVLRAIGVRRPSYSFTGHVTLAYVEQTPDPQSIESLTRTLNQLNRYAFVEPCSLTVSTAQLRKFDDLSHYYRQPNWPELHFNSTPDL